MQSSKVFGLAALALVPVLGAAQGSVFVTGHDSDWHAQEGGSGAVAAQHVNQAAMAFVWSTGFNKFYTNDGIHKFLYVGDDGYQGADSHTGSPGVIDSGYSSGQFDVATSANIASLLPQLGTTYSALWVGSSSAELSQALLNDLNANSALIANFINAGGGIYASAEEQYGIVSGAYGYIPGINSAAPFGQGENTITLTPFGASLGLTNTDVDSNFSHNIFTAADGLNVVDHDGSGNIVSLAGRGFFGDQVIHPSTPSPAAVLPMAIGCLSVLARRRRQSLRN